MAIQRELLTAVELALAGDWDTAHVVAQAHEGDAAACWLHAVLHKIEGDEGNSRYWYRRSGGHDFADYLDPNAELEALRAELVRRVG